MILIVAIGAQAILLVIPRVARDALVGLNIFDGACQSLLTVGRRGGVF